jgi:hypothetical protein
MKKTAPKGSSEAFLRAHLRDHTDKCILWPFKLRPSGYGLAVLASVQMHAHRWACILAHGAPPNDEYHAAHSCGHPSCINPDHLRWATPKENSDDRYNHGTIIYGEKSGKTALTADDIRAIRAAPPDLKYLMGRYGVSKGCISKIRSRQRWPHIKSEAA